VRRQEWDAYAASRAPGSKYTAPEGIVILDALAATGLRSIRYLKEIPGVSKVVINDMLPDATQAATKNVVRNGVPLDR
jgi:tRNA (guanine26-N2/guanine27-N2)-dimethyltransferase